MGVSSLESNQGWLEGRSVRLVLDASLDLAEVLEHRVNHLEGLVDLLTDLGTSEDDLATNEDEKHNFRLNHSVNETREQLRLIGAEIVVARRKTLEPNGELDVARADNILDLEVRELGVEAELLDDTRVLAASKLRVILGFGTSNYHLARGEDQSRRLGLTNSHDDSSETLWVVLRISSMQGNGLEVQSAIEIDSRHNVLKSRSQATSAGVGSGRGGRSSGSHPGSVRRLTSIDSGRLAIWLDVLWGPIQSVLAIWKGKRAGFHKTLGLGGVRGMSLDGLHDEKR